MPKRASGWGLDLYIADIEEAVSRIAATPFDPETFPYDFIAAYDAPPATVTRIRNGTQNASGIPGGVLWRQKLHLLICAPGRVEAALEELQTARTTTSQRVQFVAATDGQEFAARDLRADDTIFCALDELGDKFGFFLPLAGYSRFKAAEENPVDVKASNKLSRFYDALIAENPEWGAEDMRHAINLFMTRIIFCLFAEDTGILREEKQFARAIHENGGHSGEEMVRALTLIFSAMSTKEAERGELPLWASRFPWVNGGLFAGNIQIPRFSRTAYRTLCDAARLRWNEINADIFGSMIQVIVDPEHRHETGMHYTSVPNILKALDPLFLDELRTEAARPALADGSREKARLKALLNRLSKIRVFDPACGSGNFLVIAYQELRKIERQVLDRLRALTGQTPGIWSHIELHNFYGIEVSDFAAETAKLSLWIAKYQMDRAHRDVFGAAPPALPLTDSGTIVRDNALRCDWLEVCPPPTITRNRKKVLDLATVAEVHGTEVVPDEEAQTFIVGNPPYLGRAKQTRAQKDDKVHLFDGIIQNYKSLDYVAGWIWLSARYIDGVPQSKAALVTTNSICQGQQVGILWPPVLEKCELVFAHQSFKWKNNAAAPAGVTVVVLGLSKAHVGDRLIFSDANVLRAKDISPYILPGPLPIVTGRRRPISEIPTMDMGNMPLDGGGLIIDDPSEAEQYSDAFRAAHVKKLIGSTEIIEGTLRLCLWFDREPTDDELSEPGVRDRIEAVADMRSKSTDAGSRSHANEPWRFRDTKRAVRSLVAVGTTSSENREVLPVAWYQNDTIVTNLGFAMYDAPLWTMSLVASRLHLLWVETVCGKLETRYRYSNTLGWHTFPVPALSIRDRDRLTACAEAILLARAEVGGTLAALYDPTNMPDLLRQAHRENDQVLEAIYSDRPFRSDADRLSHLFRRYARMLAVERGEKLSPEFDLDAEEQAV
jgi:hypothetical protein